MQKKFFLFDILAELLYIILIFIYYLLFNLHLKKN